jgi:hypothetical protein
MPSVAKAWCDRCGLIEVRYAGLECWLCHVPSPDEKLRRRADEALRERAERKRLRE